MSFENSFKNKKTVSCFEKQKKQIHFETKTNSGLDKRNYFGKQFDLRNTKTASVILSFCPNGAESRKILLDGKCAESRFA